MARNPQVSESAHTDANQQFSVIGVQGTFGTSDVGGTAATVAFSGDPATGAQYVYNLGPAGSVTMGDITGGTINRIGSIDIIGTMPAFRNSQSHIWNIKYFRDCRKYY